MSDPRAERIREHLQRRFQPQLLEIVNDGDKHIGHAHSGGGHFTVRITAAEFAGRPRLQRHRLVYAALSDMLPQEIHALSIQASSPEEVESV